ncbi:uncharacterized protein BO95DRAFT_434299 [Aspergillus brunneoviolaceus CBS 621.78]|uniref:Uncharacterized protein n=2 Tax=Aspergillus TaxID=5052 RepID=A0A8G1W678_9EURO|nr:hypothetical protein BO95DRAFT_434299 [Aspergillus brunneoviolaceus CBS 621.78]XP_040806004.1 uncharacterized protein BO72DRAFT_454800 [Aspergillus fijiensis CBS 313.89]RAH43053.1 hypothetical protein BO95DRAFT_434299 [Aspergillus brunneoviolaceus CBS 621.78]RAK81994.1 hypothetical protein BO72DRAFT_454800 [Aspergillus fijiensis CBS 313.89]
MATEAPTEAPTEGLFERCSYTVTTDLYPDDEGVGTAIETLRLYGENLEAAGPWPKLAARLLRERWGRYPLVEGKARRRAAVVICRDRVRMFVDDRSSRLARIFVFRDEIEWHADGWYEPVLEALSGALADPRRPSSQLRRVSSTLGQQ